MGYKHEQDIKAVIYGYAKYLGDDTVIDELDDVYAKARAFDEIRKLRNHSYIYSKTSSGSPIAILDAKTFGREASHLINKYGFMEDK